MVTKTKLAHKTIWALEDIKALCADARDELSQALQRAEKHMDVALMASLARLSQQIGEMDALTRDARQGEYHGRGRKGG